MSYAFIFLDLWKLIVHCWKLWEKFNNSHGKQYFYYFYQLKHYREVGCVTKITQSVKLKQKTTWKGFTLISKWSNSNNVVFLTNPLSTFIFSKSKLFLVCFNIKFDLIRNFATFSAVIYKKNLLWAALRMFIIVIFKDFKDILNQFWKHMEATILA